MPKPAPDKVALLRRRYAERAPISAIQAETGIWPIATFYQCVDGRYDDGSGAALPLPALPRRRPGAQMTSTSTRRLALVSRIWRSAEQQVGQIEERLARSGLKSDERDARSLAILVRTLRELSEFEKRRSASTKPKAEDERPIPRNVEDLRRELAKKMDALIESRTPNR